MNLIEAKIIRSFKELKSDIIDLQNEFMEISSRQDNLIQDFGDIKAKIECKPVVKTKTIVKTKLVRPKKVNKYVSSKTSKKFHIEACPFAQNIKPKSKKFYKSKNEALNSGLKPCNCVK